MSTYNVNSVVINLLHGMASKENAYKQGISKNHGLCKTSAKRLVQGGRDSQTLHMMTEQEDPIVSAEEVEEFLNEQRRRLKNLARENVQDERTIESYCQALRQVSQKISRGELASTVDDEPDDFHDILQAAMKQNQAEKQATLPPMEQETYHREICTELGEQPAARDEEIEVMRTEGSDASNLKCPITTRMLEDPVKSSNCTHLYSREAIENQIRRGDRKCPVPGCSNHQLSLADLTPDSGAEFMVRRELRRLAMERENQISQTVDDDSDEEF